MPLNVIALLMCAVALSGCGRSAETRRELADLRNEVAALRLQVQVSRDWTSIANLQAAYGYHLEKRRWDDAAELFATYAKLEVVGHGLFEGRENIRTYLHALEQPQYRALLEQALLQPVIHIGPDGLKAEATWRALLRADQGRAARWAAATYENEYVKEGGSWKISVLHAAFPAELVAPYRDKTPVPGRDSR
jgi:hypothetical protein